MAPYIYQSHALGMDDHTKEHQSGLLQVPTTMDQGQCQNHINIAQHNMDPLGESNMSLSYAPL
jgi:hypothetical protein